ncbi:hypothetical protein D9619_002045 [Psilocybe cf. subviscida]|uniref:Fungal-type protein kinase domain-containing protein n=1 Tax=Psilocybe cf. subviscida TaxID=2480587 RepID=A0A8H5BDJ2_9AGAR|nr:hypothetical protein D9619_002045 [Psilocybe cf. subviscida]
MASSNELTVNLPKPEFPETPQGQQFTTKQLGAEGTPHGIKETAGLQALDQIRFQIARQMNNETLLCPIDNFLEHYGPTTVKAADVKKCKKFLITSNLFDEETGRWTDFAANPSQYEDKEDRVFQDLKPIVDKIFEFAKGRRNNYKFQVVEHKYLEADIPGTNHKMDGCLVDGEFKTGKIPVRFIKSPHEYKKQRNTEDQRMVRAQVVGDCQHILCEDPRRMFIFAVTIEDTRMGVWYFSRSHSIKALSFDWVEKDVDTFIHVFLAFAYASPEELGIDPTVHLAPIDPQAKPGTEAAAQHYIYQCPVEVGAEEPQDAKDTIRRSARLTGPKFKYFKTVRSINDMRPYNISGRNTRIWQVVEVKGPDTNETVTGEQLILKDVWLDIHRSTEAENMDAIFKAIDELIENSQSAWGDNWKERLVEEDQRFASFDDPTKARLQHSLTDGNYKSLFLTKLHAWDGATSKKLCHGALNSAAGVDIFPEESATEKAGRDCRTAQGSLIGSLVGSSYAGNSVDPNNTLHVQDRKADAVRKARRQFAPKRQSRFIYKEVCFDLDKVGTLGNLMDLISQALDALRILFCAGWVHQDISSSNLLAFRDNGKWKIKLADLEFAQELGYNSKGTDLRTGTPFFMPFEIMKRFHLLNDKRGQANPELSMANQQPYEPF